MNTKILIFWQEPHFPSTFLFLCSLSSIFLHQNSWNHAWLLLIFLIAHPVYQPNSFLFFQNTCRVFLFLLMPSLHTLYNLPSSLNYYRGPLTGLRLLPLPSPLCCQHSSQSDALSAGETQVTFFFRSKPSKEFQLTHKKDYRALLLSALEPTFLFLFDLIFY